MWWIAFAAKDQIKNSNLTVSASEKWPLTTKSCGKILRFLSGKPNGKLRYLDCVWNIPSTCKFWNHITVPFFRKGREGSWHKKVQSPVVALYRMMSMCHSISRITACFCLCGLQEHATQCVVFDFPSNLPVWRRNKSSHSIEVCVVCSVFSVLRSDLWCFVCVCVCVLRFPLRSLPCMFCFVCCFLCAVHGVLSVTWTIFWCVLLYMHVYVVCM